MGKHTHGRIGHAKLSSQTHDTKTRPNNENLARTNLDIVH